MLKSLLNNLLTIFAAVGFSTACFSQGDTTVTTSLFSKKDTLSAVGLKIGKNYYKLLINIKYLQNYGIK